MEEFIYMFALLMIGAGIFGFMKYVDIAKRGKHEFSKGIVTEKSKSPFTFWFCISCSIILSCGLVFLGAAILYAGISQ